MVHETLGNSCHELLSIQGHIPIHAAQGDGLLGSYCRNSVKLPQLATSAIQNPAQGECNTLFKIRSAATSSSRSSQLKEEFIVTQ